MRRAPARALERGAAATVVPWIGANIVPLVLIPLAAVFVWVAIWKVWLPRPGGTAALARTVTTTDADAATRPRHKVTTVTKTVAPASPSRRSEPLVIVLLFLGAGAAVVAVFHDRIGSIELDKDGLKITLTRAEQAGAAALVDRLARAGAGSQKYASGLRRYLRTVAAQRASPGGSSLTEATAPGLTAARAKALAERIADDLS
jgi:hypothetical protein